MPWPKLCIATRPSRLARTQADLVRTAINRCIPDLHDKIDVVAYDTPGDRNRSSHLEELGGRGVFTNDLDALVSTGEIDCAVHAMKDMAPNLRDDLVIAATLEREDPREVLVAPHFTNLDAMPTGAMFGSSSIRRRALLKRLRPDLQFTLLRGNVEERIAQVETRPYDGTILAYAGLARLGLLSHACEIFPLDMLPPDPAQGAIGIVCHRDNFMARRVLQMINHAPTFVAVSAERALLRALPTPDALAIGAIARVQDKRVALSALLVSEDGSEEWSEQAEGPTDSAEVLGHSLGLSLRAPAQRLLSA